MTRDLVTHSENWCLIRRVLTALPILALLLQACSGSSDSIGPQEGSPSAPPPPPPPPTAAAPSSLDESLTLLGVSTDESPRLSNDGSPLPDDFSPYGQRLKMSIVDDEVLIGAPDEYVFGGFALANATSSFSATDNLQMPNVSTDPITPTVLRLINDSEGWVREDTGVVGGPPTRLRDATGGDLDGDGYDELIVAYFDSNQVWVRITNLGNTAIAERTVAVPMPSGLTPIADIRVATGDLAGDGGVEVVLAISQPADASRATRTDLLILGYNGTVLESRFSRSFSSTLGNDVGVTTVLEAGNADYDVPDEVVLILNEFVGSQEIPIDAATRFFVIDDANTDFAELATDTLSVETPTATYLAQVADVAFGDIDNDFINELVFGGLADFSVARSCNDGDNGNPGSLRYLLVTYDYVSTTLEKSGTAFSSDNDWNVLYPGNCSNSPATRAIRNVFVNVLNFDSDRDAEIQANQFIFSGLPEHGWDWAQRADFTLPQTVLMSDENTDLVFDSSSNSIVIDDIDGNGFDDIVTYTGGDSAVRIYSWRESLDPQSGDAIPELFQSGFIAVETSDPNLGTIAGTRINPILVRFDGDGVNEGDVQTLQFVDHVFTLTEPVVLAAIAAPPCTNEPWQNREACTSSWGRAETSGTDAEREISFKAGITIGFEAEYQAGAGFVVDASTKVFGISAKLALSQELGFYRSEAYEVTRSISFETGPMENSVVFTSIPIDFYNYEVIASTNVDTVDLGADRELQRLGLPRTPVIRMAEVEYYNAHTTDTAVKIDDSVFQHTIGRLDSYPDPFEREQILSTRQTQLDDVRLACPGCWQLDPDAPLGSGNNPVRQFDPVSALPGLVSDLVGVGQGGGATEVAIDFSRSSTEGKSLNTSAELEVEVTVGYVVGGVAVGGGLSHSTNITRGESTTYVGTVGSIDADNFADNQYRLGMFTYLQADAESGQEFEVINYWVE